MIIESMAAQGKEPTFCMGDDIPLAILSQKPHMLYDYFKQRFAQVHWKIPFSDCRNTYGCPSLCNACHCHYHSFLLSYVSTLGTYRYKYEIIFYDGIKTFNTHTYLPHVIKTNLWCLLSSVPVYLLVFLLVIIGFFLPLFVKFSFMQSSFIINLLAYSFI